MPVKCNKKGVSDNLVKAAQQAIDEQGDDPDSVALNTSAVNNVVEVSDNNKKYIICRPFPFPTKNDFFFSPSNQNIYLLVGNQCSIRSFANGKGA